MMMSSGGFFTACFPMVHRIDEIQHLPSFRQQL
jgi:hypothetical protein